MSDSLSEKDWQILIQRIEDKKCTPFLGAGAAQGILPLGSEIAKQWADKYGYPMADASNLIAVAQFVALTRDSMTPKEEIVRLFTGNQKGPDFSDPVEPHRVLASLPVPIYVTTNYDNFMTQALINQDKDPRRELCRWNRYVKDLAPSFDQHYVPSVANPVVFHLHGYVPLAESLVLTEDDYMDFLVNISRESRFLPAIIEKAFTGTSLLFIGYRIADWNFRVLLKGLVGFMESGLRRTHFAVIRRPSASASIEERVHDYLAEYYGNIDVRVYWGTAREFMKELLNRLAHSQTA